MLGVLELLACACWCRWCWLLFVCDEHINGSCGLDDEKYLDVCSFPPRIGRHGVKGCKAEHINFYILRRHPSECDKRERNKNYKKDKENYLLNRDDFFYLCTKAMEPKSQQNIQNKWSNRWFSP